MTEIERIDMDNIHKMRRMSEDMYNGPTCEVCGELIRSPRFYIFEGDKMCRSCFQDAIDSFIDEHEYPTEGFERF